MKILLLTFCLVTTCAASLFNWTSHQLPGADEPITAIRYANGQFVAIGPRLTLYYSSDGKSWSQGSITAASGFSFDSFYNLTGIAHGNGTWIILGTKVANEMMLRSTDGVNWTASAPANLPRPAQLSFDNGIFYATDISDDGIHTSTNGDSWTKVLSTPVNPVLAVPSPVGFAIALQGGAMHFSSDLSTLQGPVLQTPSSSVFQHIGYHNGQFIAADEFRQTYLSSDGINWQTFSGQFPQFHEARGIAYTQAGYLAATWRSSTTEGFILSSNDANAWTHELTASASFYSISSGNGTVVAGASDGVVYTGVPATNQIRQNSDGSITVAFPAPKNTSVTLRASSSLDSSSWQELTTGTTNTESFSLTVPFQSGTRFFQLTW